MNKPLTDEQIKNWKRILAAQIGPYAFLMSRETIQLYRNRIQKFLDQTNNKNWLESQICSCDPNYHGATTRRDGSVICNHCQKERQTR